MSILGNHYVNPVDNAFADLEVRVLGDSDYNSSTGDISNAAGTVCNNSGASITAGGGDIICNHVGSAVLITKASGASNK